MWDFCVCNSFPGLACSGIRKLDSIFMGSCNWWLSGIHYFDARLGTGSELWLSRAVMLPFFLSSSPVTYSMKSCGWDTAPSSPWTPSRHPPPWKKKKKRREKKERKKRKKKKKERENFIIWREGGVSCSPSLHKFCETESMRQCYAP